MDGMRTWLALGAVVAVVGGVGSVALAAQRHTSARVQTLRFDRHDVEEQGVDVDPAGPSIGDQHLFATDLLKDGKRVGYESELCTTARTQPEQWQCYDTMSIRGGQITGQGVFTLGKPFQFAITGGTGAYHRAAGFVDASPQGVVVHIERR